MLARIKHTALALAISMGAFTGASCGSSTPPPDAPTTSEGTPSGSGDASQGGKAEGAPQETAQGGKEAAPAQAAAPAAGPSKPLQATQMEAELKKIGLNLAKLPELEKMPLGQKKKVMPLFQKALGFEDCKGCHEEGDFKKETRNMKVARQMWKHFVVPLRAEGGGALFCDSCHGGSAKVLNRSDRKAVEKFMEDEYEHKLVLASKDEAECSTCHGDAMEIKIIEKLWSIPK